MVTAFEQSDPSTIFSSFSGETRATEEKIAPILHAREGTLCYIQGKRNLRPGPILAVLIHSLEQLPLK